MFSSIQICRVFGIPIRVHFTLLLFLPFFASELAPRDSHSGIFWGLLGAVALFASVALHELGHSVAALAKGYHVRDITLWPIGGVAMLTQFPTRAWDEFVIAIAGPLVSLALGIIGMLAGPALAVTGLGGLGFVTTYVVGYVNIGLFLFNLIPAFPMDGGRILRAALTKPYGRLEATRKASSLSRFLAVVYGVYSLLHGNFIAALIALFVFNAAGSEYRMVQLQEMQQWNPLFDFFGRPVVPPAPDIEVEVSPPPYKR
ncbi:MAG: site-2 protease family protein [bacterium]